MTDRWTDRLSEYLDGDLPVEERLAIEVHLPDCPTCRATLGELRRVVQRAHAAVDQPVTGDLWPGIAARIGTAGDPVVDLTAERARRRIHLSVPQLAAAAVLFLAVGAGAALTVVGPQAGVPVASAPGGVSEVRVLPVGLPTPAEQSYDAAVLDLERVLAAGRDKLSPRTVQVLERNLDRIDVAIAEARAALKADPANAYLSGHLAATMQQKLALLQQATVLADAAS